MLTYFSTDPATIKTTNKDLLLRVQGDLRIQGKNCTVTIQDLHQALHVLRAMPEPLIQKLMPPATDDRKKRTASKQEEIQGKVKTYYQEHPRSPISMVELAKQIEGGTKWFIDLALKNLKKDPEMTPFLPLVDKQPLIREWHRDHSGEAVGATERKIAELISLATQRAITVRDIQKYKATTKRQQASTGDDPSCPPQKKGKGPRK